MLADITVSLFFWLLALSPLIFFIWFIGYRPSKKNLQLKKEMEERVNEINKLKDDYGYKDKIDSLRSIFFDQENKNHLLSLDIEDQKRELRKIKKEIKSYDGDMELITVGLYRPIFNFDTSEEYKINLMDIRKKQEDLVKSGQAIISLLGIGKGSMIKDHIRLALRAFNGESDSLIARVTGRNITQIRGKIEKSFEYINKLNTRNNFSISPQYLSLKINEVMAAYEYAVKKEEEKAEQVRIKEEMREEIRAQKELEKAKLDAEKQQREAEKELEYARKLLEKDKTNTLLQERLAELEQLYQEALERTQRAISQAQLTKSGYVYVISNIGSFGENVFKIGMTRRLEPMERIRELGDASVPFSFDVHALIYSENAPALESELHRVFADKQVNRVNPRKEFFKVPLEQIAVEVKKRNANIQFTMLAEASEYYQSLAMEKEHLYVDIEETEEEQDLDE